MRSSRVVVGTLLFLVVAPGVVAGVIPWVLTGWERGDVFGSLVLVRVAGGVVLVVGVTVLLEAFARFVLEGRGTPAPVAPTERLVVGGLYRFVRNPMYLAVGAAIVGQAFLLGRPILLVYAAVFFVIVAAFVHWYEEPTLARRYGAQYEAYRRAVPGWLPRRTPWRGEV
ncbi:MAG TPA: isoprenylcysteine carboxylmethyltransferase family protein [Gaiella sp.]